MRLRLGGALVLVVVGCRSRPPAPDAGAPAAALAPAASREEVPDASLAPPDASLAPPDASLAPPDAAVRNSSAAPAVLDAGAALCSVAAPRTPSGPPEPAVVAGARYSIEVDGAVVRRQANGPPKILAHARPGTRIAAAPLGDGHAVVAYLADRKTTEGVVMVAYAVLDDGEPVRLSEDGSGATFVTLVPRGDGVLAAYVDARSVLTPVHARTLTRQEGALRLGPDAVVFVGGAPEGLPRLALAAPKQGPALALLPMPEGARQFGMAVIRIDDPPADDEPFGWSLYPEGLRPAPVAATHVGGRPYFARVRPASDARGAPHVLELGRLDGETVTLLGLYATAPRITEVELAAEEPLLKVWLRAPEGWSTLSVRCP